SVIEKSTTYLHFTERIPISYKLKLADQFRLHKLRRRCIDTFKTVDEIKALKKTHEFYDYSDKMKAALLEKVMEL
ncbi:hypothetical protein PFISCL1PPCAC_21955, partial [Pristionchus fissidentatus]